MTSQLNKSIFHIGHDTLAVRHSGGELRMAELRPTEPSVRPGLAAGIKLQAGSLCHLTIPTVSISGKVRLYLHRS